MAGKTFARKRNRNSPTEFSNCIWQVAASTGSANFLASGHVRQDFGVIRQVGTVGVWASMTCAPTAYSWPSYCCCQSSRLSQTGYRTSGGWFLDGGPCSYERRFHNTQNGTSRRSAAWLTPAKFVEPEENQLQLERGSQVRGTQNLQCKEAATISTAMSCRPFRTITSVMESVL
jgi:hypothetical protein